MVLEEAKAMLLDQGMRIYRTKGARVSSATVTVASEGWDLRGLAQVEAFHAANQAWMHAFDSPPNPEMTSVLFAHSTFQVVCEIYEEPHIIEDRRNSKADH